MLIFWETLSLSAEAATLNEKFHSNTLQPPGKLTISEERINEIYIELHLNVFLSCFYSQCDKSSPHVVALEIKYAGKATYSS